MKYETSGEARAVAVRHPKNFPVHADKAIIVTGAARGLGRSVAQTLVSQGARVALLDVLEAELHETTLELGGPDRGLFAVPVDLADSESIERAFGEAVAALGSVDGLANVAGATRHADALEIGKDVWDFVLGINLIGTHEMSQRAGKYWRDSGRAGAIVNVASEAGKIGHKESIAYSASKAALINETRMMAEALAPYDINVNCVCPGGLPTVMLRKSAANYSRLTSEDADSIYTRIVSDGGQLGRAIELDEVSRVISFLLSDSATVVRGQAINVDAGSTPY